MTDNIPNWHMFGVHFVCIDLYEYEDSYNAHAIISLDGGEKFNSDMAVTLITDHWDDDPVDCAVHAALSLGGLFKLSYTVNIWSIDGDALGKFELPQDPYDDYNVDIDWVDVSKSSRPKKSGIFKINYKD